ncbi:MAG TPA: DUF1800 family protein, partial [Steroidobacteraceae bacterium]|nr:DUF1800 family protein [Steroidobacteraceae bacterium]
MACTCLLLFACASQAPRPRSDIRPAASPEALTNLRRQDALWLERVGFGVDSVMVKDYRRLGRTRWLDQQLGAHDETLPPAIAAQLQNMEVSHLDAQHLLADVQARQKAINAMADGPDRESARRTLNDSGNRAAYDSIRRQLLRAVYSPNQLREQMVWFWLNHFSVYQYKSNLRWLIGDYEETAIRPYALGH